MPWLPALSRRDVADFQDESARKRGEAREQEAIDVEADDERYGPVPREAFAMSYLRVADSCVKMFRDRLFGSDWVDDAFEFGGRYPNAAKQLNEAAYIAERALSTGQDAPAAPALPAAAAAVAPPVVAAAQPKKRKRAAVWKHTYNGNTVTEAQLRNSLYVADVCLHSGASLVSHTACVSTLSKARVRKAWDDGATICVAFWGDEQRRCYTLSEGGKQRLAEHWIACEAAHIRLIREEIAADGRERERKEAEEKKRVAELEGKAAFFDSSMIKPSGFGLLRASERCDADNALACHICYSKLRSVELIPCKHLRYCAECVASLYADGTGGSFDCPDCRTRVTGYRQPFM